MERLTHLNGNNDIYFLVDGVRGRIDEIEELRVAEKLKYYEDLEEQGRLLVLPDDGMIYHIEENENNRWIGNKPIQDIIFKSGWGFVGLEYHLWDLGKKFFFSREEAEKVLNGE